VTAVLVLDCILTLLIDRLGHPRYAQRQAAHRRLAAAGALVRTALERAQAHPNAEVRVRVEQLLAPWQEQRLWVQSGRIRPTVWPHTPWLSLPQYGGSGYLAQARKKLPAKGRGAPDWPEYRAATRLWVLSQLRQRRPRDEIVAELDRMADEEWRWILEHNKARRKAAAAGAGRK
jgi:hypothetical protein